MQVLRLRRTNRELLVEAFQEVRQEDVAGLHIANVVESQLLHQAVLQRAVDTLHASGRLAIPLSVLFAIAASSRACGPFFTEAVFVQRTGPDGPYAAYVGGRIGVPQPGYRMRHLVVAYDWLNGHGLSPAEQQQAMELESTRIPSSLQRDSPDASAGLTAWVAARQASGVAGGPRDCVA